jgi:hypothetical protein
MCGQSLTETSLCGAYLYCVLRPCAHLCVFNKLEYYRGHCSPFWIFRTLWKLNLLFPASDINDPIQCGRLEKASITCDNNIPSFRKFGGTQHEGQYTVTQYREKGLCSTLCFCYVNEPDVKVVTCVIDKERIALITSCKPTRKFN